MSVARPAKRPFLISFSGIDGAGKTTQIEELSSQLQSQGLRVQRLSFWDDVAIWTRFRSEAGQRAARLHQLRNPADATFVAKNHKHIRKWYLTVVRSSLYLLDVLRLRRVLRRASVRDAHVVIFDRYIYDQIANIDSNRSATRFYARFLLRRTPRPDLALILDAVPDAAFARKPEYPLRFIHRNRQSFLNMRELAPFLVILPAAEVEQVNREILEHVRRLFPAAAAIGEITEPSGDMTVGCGESSCRVRNEPTTRV